HHAVFADVLLVHSEHGRRCREQRLAVLVYRVAVDLAATRIALVAGFAHAQDHRLHVAVEAAHELHRANLVDVPRPDGVRDRLDDRVLADALRATEHDRMVDLLAWALHTMGEPADDVLGLVGEDALHMRKPRTGSVGAAVLDHRRTVQVEGV